MLAHSIAVNAGWFGADFSAEVVQGSAQGQGVKGRMYVSKGRVRTEMEQNGGQIVEIIDPLKGVAWVLDPQQQSYRQRSVPKVAPGDKRSANPCDGISGAQCRQLPDEMLNGRSTHKWLLRINGKERVQWVDARHGFPLQVLEGGQVVMTMAFVAEERMGTRHVERWHALQRSGKAVIESDQWYDPQLNIAIRQQAKDGSFRQLRNIQLGEQADELFVLPSGYSSMDGAAR